MKEIVLNEFRQAGMYHSQRNEENQDFYILKQNEHYLVAVLADGVSTQKNSLKGAKKTCEVAANYVLRRADDFMEYDQREVAKYILKEICFQLDKEAKKECEDIISYSSTMLLLMLNKDTNNMITMNLGDGIILGSKNRKTFYVSRGKGTNNETLVTTSREAYRDIDICKMNYLDCDRILLASDGIKPFVDDCKQNNHISLNKLTKLVKDKQGYDDCSFVEIKLVNIAKKTQKR